MDPVIPSRELDALVAERVMGVTQFHESGFRFNENAPMGFWAQWIGCPPFSSDIAAAWGVVEKMEADGFDYIVSPDEVLFDRGVRTSPDYLCGSCMDEGIPRPLAICIAALRAMGEDV